MFKFAAKILDQFDETTQDLLKKIAEDLPEFVRDAVVPDARELELISDYDFAIVYHNLKSERFRKYLLVDPGNIWLSAKYFLEARESWPKIAQGIIVRNILVRAEKHGISHYSIFNKLREIKTALTSEGLWRKLPEQNIYDEKLFHREQKKEEILKDQQKRSGGNAKTPSEKLSRVFALQTGDDNWVDRPMYDITTPDLVKKACVYFDEYKNLLPLKSKRKFARAVSTRAQELGIDIPKSVSLYGSTEVNTKLAQELLIRRAKMCADGHRKLAADIAGNMTKIGSADELIACIEAFDKKAFGGEPGRFGLPDPVMSVVGESGDDKVVHSSEIGQMSLKDLKSVVTHKEAKLREVFEGKVVESLKKDPEKAFKALPGPYKRVIAGLAK